MSRKKTLFDTSHFKDAQYTNAVKKRKILNDWIRFIENGFQYCHFTKGLYSHLTLHCEFIAHYNREGFHSVYFCNPEHTQRFLDQFDRTKGCVSVEYGMTHWIHDGNDVSAQYYDLNNAMVDSIAGILPEIRKQLAEKTLENAKQQLQAAQAKVDSLLAERSGG